MRAVLTALTEELKRLKSTGVRNVSVSPEAVAALRDAVRKTAGAGPEAEDRSSPAVTAKVKERPRDAFTTGPAAEARSLVAAPAPAAGLAPPSGPTAEGPAVEPRPAASRPPTPAAPTAPAGLAPVPAAPPAFTLPEGDKATRWAALKKIVLEDATCRAHVRPGKQVVLGVGSLDAKIFFCGEAPGAEEEVQGEPFVGPAGQLLTKMIQGMGLARSDVYIGNIMNWRPEMPVSAGGVQIGNRPPSDAEMRYCLPYLRAQLAIVNPDVIVALGATAAQGLLGAGSFTTLGQIRGQWRDFAGKPIMVTYHPSYILRNNSNRAKRAVWEDLLLVMERVGLPISAKQRSYFLDK